MCEGQRASSPILLAQLGLTFVRRVKSESDIWGINYDNYLIISKSFSELHACQCALGKGESGDQLTPCPDFRGKKMTSGLRWN